MKYIILFLIFLTITSFEYSDESFAILNSEDWKEQYLERNEPALRIPLKNEAWLKSFNQWRCYPAHQINIEKAEVDYGGWHEIPSIKINLHSGRYLSFDLDPDEPWDTEKVISDWNSKLSNAENVCIYSAYLQSHQESDMYYVEKIKFGDKYWSRTEVIENFFSDIETAD